jgi:hypothetical protein
MAIFRGQGGAGDATTDAANEAIVAVQAAQEAEASKIAAANSASSAATSATSATTSATSATNSSNSASASASSASASANIAQTAQTNAETAETNAAASASAASVSESNAATSATSASTSATTATNEANNAVASATSALTSANTATTKADEASTSASNAATSETNASGSATSAATSATNASNSATSAATSATTATTQAGIATTQASNASTSATNASNSASAAATSATNAANSATNAATSATNASNSATSAAGSAAVAESIAESLVLEFKPLVNPTLDLDFSNNDYTIYDSFANSYTDKPYADILTVTNGVATGFDAIGVLRNSVANNIRLVFDPETGVSQGALVEPAATNLLLYSEEFDNAYWTKTRTTVTANAITAPDRTLTADKIVETVETGFKIVRNTTAIITSGISYAHSIYAKAAERTQVRVAFATAFAGQAAVVDLITGAVISGTANVEKLKDGWFRISASHTSTATSTLIDVGPALAGSGSYTGDGTSGIYLWRAQLETGSVPTSGIKTEASTVTRVRDNVTRTFLNEFNPTGFSWFFDYTPLSLVGTFGGLANTFADTVYLTQASVFLRENNVSLGNVTITNTINIRAKLMITYSNKTYKVFFNGVLLATSTGTTEQVNYLRLRIANAPWTADAAGAANITTNKSQLYPRALTEAECIALTTL